MLVELPFPVCSVECLNATVRLGDHGDHADRW
jgi:hypothetical protein